MTKLFQLKFLRASLYLIFVAFFLSHRYALAENMPSREEIFENFAIGRPAVNQTGSLVAVSGLNGANLISMLDVKFPNNDRILNIDGINQIYWYRWSAQKNDVLIISCKQNRRDVIVEFDIKKGLLNQVISSAEEQSSSFATTKNNYAFTYDRYWNKENKSLSELTTDGDLIPVQDRRNLFPATNQPGNGFIHVGFQNGEMVWSFGVEKNKQTQLKINAMNQRQGTGLVSIASSNHHAYFLSSVNTDTLGLLEIDLKSGEQKIIAQENADIRKVILNPSTHIPEAVEYENTKPVFKVLGNSIIDDIAFLSSRGLGIPSVVDRSPNDLFWIVKYAHGDGFPIFAIYDKKINI